MAAPTQAAQDRKAPSLYAEETTEGVEMFHYYGGLKIGSGVGSPNGEVTAPKGSLFIDRDAPNLYMNTDSSTTWELVGGQT